MIYQGERIEQRVDGRWIIPEVTPGSFRTESAAKRWLDRLVGVDVSPKPHRRLVRRRRRARRNPTGTAIATALGGGALALFGAYKSYENFQAASDAADKAEAAKIANPQALATWTKTESDSTTAAWTWGVVGLIGGGIAAVSLLSK